MHTGKELEVHQGEKGRLSWDGDAPQIGSARSDWTRVVKVGHLKTNRRKTRPYRILKDQQMHFGFMVVILLHSGQLHISATCGLLCHKITSIKPKCINWPFDMFCAFDCCAKYRTYQTTSLNFLVICRYY